MGRSSLVKSPVDSHRRFCARGQHFRPHREGRRDILAQGQCGQGRAGAARSKWEWAACPVPWNTGPWGHAAKGQGLGRRWAMLSRIRTTPEGPLPRGLSQALAAPVQQNRQMATSVPLWPLAPGGPGQCGTARPGGTGHPGCRTASGRQWVIAWPSPSPDSGGHRAARGEHGLRTGVRLCQPMLTPGSPFCPSQVTAGTENRQMATGCTSPSHGLWCKQRGRHFQHQPQLHRCTLGQRLAMESPCIFLELRPLRKEMQAHF